MSKNKGLGLISALAVGAGVAAVAAGKKYKTAETKKKEDGGAAEGKRCIGRRGNHRRHAC